MTQASQLAPAPPGTSKWVIWYCMIALAGAVCMLGTVYLGELHSAYETRQAVDWPTVTGIVVESAPGPYVGRTCRPLLRFRYRYKVGNTQYTGHRYHIEGTCSAETMAVVAANPVGKHISVHYLPANPAKSVIVPSRRSYTWFIVILLGVIGLAMLLHVDMEKGRKARRAPGPPGLPPFL